MKFTHLLSAVSAAFATIAGAQQVSIHAQMTDALVDVGDLDTFWSVW